MGGEGELFRGEGELYRGEGELYRGLTAASRQTQAPLFRTAFLPPIRLVHDKQWLSQGEGSALQPGVASPDASRSHHAGLGQGLVRGLRIQLQSLWRRVRAGCEWCEWSDHRGGVRAPALAFWIRPQASCPCNPDALILKRDAA